VQSSYIFFTCFNRNQFFFACFFSGRQFLTVLPDGETLGSWRARFVAAAADKGIENPVAYGANCHDSVWTWAKALDSWVKSGRSVADLQSYEFDDIQKAIADDFSLFVQNVTFDGATGPVSFTQDTRERLGPAWMEQLRPIPGAIPGTTLSMEDVRFGLVKGTVVQYGTADSEDVFTEGIFEGVVWPGGSSNPPLDDTCVTGSIPNSDISACVFCPRGSYSNSSASVCVLCPKDRYRDQVGGSQISDCQSCPQGQSTNGAIGAESISSCTGSDSTEFVETWEFFTIIGAVVLVTCPIIAVYVLRQSKEKADLRQTIVELEGNIIIPPELEFHAGKELGRGASGVVHLTTYHGTKVAKKTLISSLTDEDRLELQQEATLMSRLRHPNCVLYMGVQITKSQVTILTEFCSNGSLFDVLHSPAEVSWENRLKMGLGIVLGMQYLHANGLCHCDLKSPNILIDEGFNAKIADFGLSRKAHSFATGDQMAMGTPRWCAPEVMIAWMDRKKANSKPLVFSPSQDVFSLGTIFWELDTRELPFPKLRFDVQVCDEVVDGGRPADIGWPSVKDHTPAQLAEIVQKCWSPDPDQRPALQEMAKKISQIKIEQVTHGRFVTSIIGGLGVEGSQGSPKLLRDVKRMYRRISGASPPPYVPQEKTSYEAAASVYHGHLQNAGHDDTTLKQVGETWSPNPLVDHMLASDDSNRSMIEMTGMSPPSYGSGHHHDFSTESGSSMGSIPVGSFEIKAKTQPTEDLPSPPTSSSSSSSQDNSIEIMS
jgi:serine/threonine protein kinase